MKNTNKTVLLTGATGFIGSNLLERLLKEYSNVVIIIRKDSDLSKIESIRNYTKMYTVGNMKFAFTEQQIDTVIHLSAYMKKQHEFEDIQTMIESNEIFPTKVLDLACKHNVELFINTGSGFEYDYTNLPVNENTPYNNFNLYATTKINFQNIFESYIERGKIKGVTVRLFTPYGKNDDVKKIAPYIILNAIEDRPFKVSEGFQKLDFMYIDDIIDLYMRIIQHNDFKLYDKKIYNFGTGNLYSIRDFISVVEQVIGYKLNPIYGEPSKVDIPLYYTSIDKIKTELEWTPKYSIYDGVKETINYYKGIEK